MNKIVINMMVVVMITVSGLVESQAVFSCMECFFRRASTSNYPSSIATATSKSGFVKRSLEVTNIDQMDFDLVIDRIYNDTLKPLKNVLGEDNKIVTLMERVIMATKRGNENSDPTMDMAFELIFVMRDMKKILQPSLLSPNEFNFAQKYLPPFLEIFEKWEEAGNITQDIRDIADNLNIGITYIPVDYFVDVDTSKYEEDN